MTTRKLQRLKYIAMTPIFVVSTFMLQFAQVPLASAATVTWDGSAGDNKFSTAANWSNDTAPVDGDVVNISTGAPNVHLTLTNDIVGLDLAGLNTTSVSGGTIRIGGEATTLSGNVVHTGTGWLSFDSGVTLGADISMTGNIFAGGSNTALIDVQDHDLAFIAPSGVCRGIRGITGSGDISITGYNGATASPYVFLAESTGYTGAISVNSGTLVLAHNSLTNLGGVAVSGAGSLLVGSRSDRTIAAPISLGGSGRFAAQHTGAEAALCTINTYNEDDKQVTTTFTGQVTLTSNFEYAGVDDVILSGAYVNNGHTFTAAQGSGTITTPSGSYTSSTSETTVADTDMSPGSSVTVLNKQTVTLSGGRTNVIVARGAVLKGTGVADALMVVGVINPGNSPGKITALTIFAVGAGGVQEVEILNKDSYDQIVAGANHTASPTYPNAVVLAANAHLKPILYDGWTIAQGDQFTIVDNKSSVAVNGTYVGLAEGAQFAIEGITFSITYVGGDGNDIVLTALNAGSDPTPPNTGVMKLLTANPVITAALGIVTVGLLMAVAIRRKATR